MSWWALGLAGLILQSGMAVAAGNSGAADAELMLGPLRTFGSENEARAVCGPGAVVWAERYAGYFFKPGEERYGHASDGAFACQADAAAANYWDTDPMAAAMGFRGKSFPSALRGYGW